ncbi:unnamed protein product [Thelazia callipaeda]|uniref:ELMO domain-containing protein n=1 Tax=Thelazia callipaeda TaxID=103827 RepID=A0A0N5D748_THECL|nr:unnamed protein product [Thelazia callipaeda]
MNSDNKSTSSFGIFQYLNFLYRRLLRIVLNWFILFVTGETQLERMLAFTSTHKGQITAEVEKLINEKEIQLDSEIWNADQEYEIATEIVDKYCSKVENKQFDEMRDSLKKSLGQIRGYRELCDAVEDLRIEKYDPGNEKHEKKLLKLWDLLMPMEDLRTRITNQWQKIGFQGCDPATDFRGMGILSLDQLIFLAQYDVAHAHSILSISNHPLHGFPMAITGINLTALTRQLLTENALKMHFYNTVPGAPTINNFHHAYCQIFKLFCAFWTKRKGEITYFNIIKKDFETQLIRHLISEDANLDKLDAQFFQ